MKHTHDVALRKQQEEIKIKIGNISSWIENIKKVLDSKDARFITMYMSKNAQEIATRIYCVSTAIFTQTD